MVEILHTIWVIYHWFAFGLGSLMVLFYVWFGIGLWIGAFSSDDGGEDPECKGRCWECGVEEGHQPKCPVNRPPMRELTKDEVQKLYNGGKRQEYEDRDDGYSPKNDLQ